VSRLIRALLDGHWGDQWPSAKAVLRQALEERARIRRAGWFS
jgi:hypothetical protein